MSDMKVSDNHPGRRSQLGAVGQILQIRSLSRGSSDYPAGLRDCLDRRAPTTITAIGNREILQSKKLALFCSIRCPGQLILQTYDLAQALRDARVTVIGGFHSPMEQECLRLLMRGTQPIIVCPARGMDARMRLPPDWKSALKAGRLLMLSPFKPELRRATADLAQRRNELLAAVADEVFIAYAAPGSRTEAFAQQLAVWGKPLLTLDSPDNSRLLELGAKIIRADDLEVKAKELEASRPRGQGMLF